MLTLGDRLSVGYVSRQLKIMATGDASGGDEARRDGDHITLAGELATPPVRAKELNELGLAVDSLSLEAGSAEDIFVQDRHVGDIADRAGGDHDDARFGSDELVAQEV